MIKEMISVIREGKITPFDSGEEAVTVRGKNIFITRDARAVHLRVIRNISSYFSFSSTRTLWDAFPLTDKRQDISARQEFFSSIHKGNIPDNSFLKDIKRPRPYWKPRYGIIVVTEDEKTYLSLTKSGIPSQLLLTENDLSGLDNYDLVQVVDCDNFTSVLESLPQTIFLNSIDDAYLERYLEIFSGWVDNIRLLSSNSSNERVREIISLLLPLETLLSNSSPDKITAKEVDDRIEMINERISHRLSGLSLSGSNVFSMLSGGRMPQEVIEIIDSEISSSGIPSHLLRQAIPVTLDSAEFERFLKTQDSDEFTTLADNVKKNSKILRNIPSLLSELMELLLIFDFSSGVKKFLSVNDSHALITDDRLRMDGVSNIFLSDPQPINFHLNATSRCSILTGANSGGKTTLIEHILQLISLSQLGLPVRGKLETPLFTEVYYFAKNKGSAQKGAFETLLTQMSNIVPGERTLILADEIESVTEPGVAGKIICATADYFINKGCFLIVATHLGQEIKDHLPPASRIDGIEARGLDENNELVVDHNPVIGRIARSTPELIVERLHRTNNHDYFKILWEKIRK